VHHQVIPGRLVPDASNEARQGRPKLKRICVDRSKDIGDRYRARRSNIDQARLVSSPAAFSFAFAGRGKLVTPPFKSVLLGTTDATGEANLAAHRCSNFL
jgi:hypothetical protein